MKPQTKTTRELAEQNLVKYSKEGTYKYFISEPKNIPDEVFEQSEFEKELEAVKKGDLSYFTTATKETLEEAAHNNYPHGSTAYLGDRFRSYYETKKESFIAGANWQKQQDEAEINRLNKTIDGLLETGSSKLSIQQYNSLLKVNKELVEALEMMLWASENGESESQKQGKLRLIDRHEKTRYVLLKSKQLTKNEIIL